MAWQVLGQPVTCKQQVEVCLRSLFYNLTLSLNEWMTPCYCLPSVSPFIMSHMHLGSFLLTHLVQHWAHWTGIHVFGAQDCLNCHAMGHLLHTKWHPLDQRVIMRISRLQQLGHCLHLYAIHVIFVIWVDECIISFNLLNQTCVLPPGPD